MYELVTLIWKMTLTLSFFFFWGGGGQVQLSYNNLKIMERLCPVPHNNLRGWCIAPLVIPPSSLLVRWPRILLLWYKNVGFKFSVGYGYMYHSTYRIEWH